ncbi:hypothetical protein, partial [Bifidobacterium sp. M0404]|uniref:hypothetical protein n=1 Tax=Bifidobacterium sp. M0404 TaxID=2750977 RepID=UPI001E287C69
PTQDPTGDGNTTHKGGGPGTQQRIHATASRPFHASTPTPTGQTAGPQARPPRRPRRGFP